MKVIAPASPAQYDAYFNLRYEVLRKPWNQPYSSAKDNQEEFCIHAMVVNDQGEAVAVCRLQYNTLEEAQLRFMGVRGDMQGKGLGKMLLDHFEEIVRRDGRKIIILHARENAVQFYSRCGYAIREKSYLMWGEIQHFLMEKQV